MPDETWRFLGWGAALVLAAGAALALGPGTNVPAFVDLGDVNASAARGTQGEVTVAVDPFVPERVIAAAMSVDDGPLLTMASEDGGESWSRTVLPLPPGAFLHADPMVAFDSRGRAHLAVIPVAPGNQPQGIDLSRSTDGGRTWSSPIRISKATGRDDKVALAADDSPESPFRDRVHVLWKWPSGGLFHSFSKDGGVTFTRAKLIDTAAVSGTDVTISAGGRVYVATSDGESRVIRVLQSSDGGESFGPSRVVAPVRAVWYTSQPSHCRRGLIVHTSITVDRSPGPHRGTVYLTWADYSPDAASNRCSNGCDPSAACTTQVFVTRSTDGGDSWTDPLALPDQVPGSDRYFQWARVDPWDGSLNVAYKDTRLDERRVRADVFISRSEDGGLTWQAPIRLSSASSDASGTTFQYGDYQALAVADGRVYAAWSDYRAPADPEIYVGRLLFGRATLPR